MPCLHNLHNAYGIISCRLFLGTSPDVILRSSIHKWLEADNALNDFKLLDDKWVEHQDGQVRLSSEAEPSEPEDDVHVFFGYPPRKKMRLTGGEQ